MDVFPNYFLYVFFDKLISKIVLVIISIRDITYKCNLKHYYFHPQKNQTNKQCMNSLLGYTRVHVHNIHTQLIFFLVNNS